MKKNTLLLIGFSIFTALLVNAQTTTFNAKNARDGENVEYCHQVKRMQELMQNPAAVLSYQQDEIIRQHEAQHNQVPKGIVYKIPVVFHILHTNGIENISDENIIDQVAILNRDFRMLNADAATVHPDFAGMPSDVEIEFVLATKAPNGACFSGITRTVNALSYNGSDGNAQVTAITNGNDVFNGSWAGNKYLNIFVCGEIGGAAGYTTNPSNFSGTSMTNGIWILYNYVSSLAPSSVFSSRALTHEVGHWLNLEHVWGSTNSPGCDGTATSSSDPCWNTNSWFGPIGPVDNCDYDDGVTDTPECRGVTSCSINSNSCNGDDAYWGSAMRDNVENYMDYSYCSKMYTQGQVDRMRAAITSSVGGRNNIWTPSNLNFTGTSAPAFLCKAEFAADKTTICAGDQIQFSDNSYNAVTGWTWSFPSGTPSSSNSQNPVVTYSTPGIYQVTLTATDGTNTDAEVKTQYIKVYESSSTIPFFDGFESYTSFANINNWEASNLNNNNTFVIDNTVSHSGMKCAKLTNFGQTGTNLDELIAYPVDLSGVTAGTGGVTLSFRYAYRKRLSADSECLKVFVTSNCGDTWVQRKTICGSLLSSTAVSTSWAPSSASDWTTIHMTNVTSEYWVDNFNYKFRFDGANGNNIYLDDINIYSGGPSDVIVVNVAELDEIDGLSLYPNPAENEVNLQFIVKDAKTVQVQIQDVTGKIVQYHNVNAAIGANLVVMDTQALSSGVYFVAIKSGESQKVMQFVVK
jgi:PKD repeat protein